MELQQRGGLTGGLAKQSSYGVGGINTCAYDTVIHAI